MQEDPLLGEDLSMALKTYHQEECNADIECPKSMSQIYSMLFK